MSEINLQLLNKEQGDGISSEDLDTTRQDLEGEPQPPSTMKNIIIMGLCFFTVIAPFIATQNVQSQVHTDLGLAVLGTPGYILAVCSRNCTSFGGRKVSEPYDVTEQTRNTFFIGGLGQFAFIASNIKVYPEILLFFSFLNGASAGNFCNSVSL